MVGGRDARYAGFNRALDARRPIGSLVKPAVYLSGLQKGYNLASPLRDEPLTLRNQGGQIVHRALGWMGRDISLRQFQVRRA